MIKNFSVPAIVIDKVSLKGVPAKLKLIKKNKKNIPGTLVEILGIDLIGGVFVSMFGFIFTPGLILGALIGYYGNDFLPTSWTII